MDIFAVPFRIDPATGAPAVVDHASDPGVAQEIAVLLLTRPGEDPLAPGFGMADPVFGQAPTAAELNAALAVYGPACTVTNVDVRQVDATTETIRIEYAR